MALTTFINEDLPYSTDICGLSHPHEMGGVRRSDEERSQFRMWFTDPARAAIDAKLNEGVTLSPAAQAYIAACAAPSAERAA